eukprot:scaffold8530_cov60-Phaeocystis_antarctica.AAC.3
MPRPEPRPDTRPDPDPRLPPRLAARALLHARDLQHSAQRVRQRGAPAALPPAVPGARPRRDARPGPRPLMAALRQLRGGARLLVGTAALPRPDGVRGARAALPHPEDGQAQPQLEREATALEGAQHTARRERGAACAHQERSGRGHGGAAG